jgi:hypothetical protein
LNREGESVARCTVERLMRGISLQGAVRGKPVKTTVSDKADKTMQKTNSGLEQNRNRLIGE